MPDLVKYLIEPFKKKLHKKYFLTIFHVEINALFVLCSVLVAQTLVLLLLFHFSSAMNL
jgi:hypothetical protein